MPSVRDLLASGRRHLARRLDQLCDTLESLSVRLRHTIANAIGDAIGNIAQDAAWSVLHAFAPGSAVRQWHTSSPENLADGEYESDEFDPWLDNEWEEDSDSDAIPAQPERLPTALSAGLQTASWWLRRCSGGCRVWTTLAVGLVTTSFAFLGGPLAVVLLHLAGTASHFSFFSDAIATGAAVIELLDSA